MICSYTVRRTQLSAITATAELLVITGYYYYFYHKLALAMQSAAELHA